MAIFNCEKYISNKGIVAYFYLLPNSFRISQNKNYLQQIVKVIGRSETLLFECPYLYLQQ